MEKPELLTQHKKDVQDIVDELLKNDPSSVSKTASHLMRPKTYRSHSRGHSRAVSDRKLCRILSFDRKLGRIWVEPYVTQETLAQVTLPHGWVLPVSAEFKKITVGGAVMGASLESSSHRFGQWNEAALSYELLLGDGSTITASKEAHPDLFWGISGSYGSLARLLSAEISLVRASPFVWVEITTFSSIDTFIEALRGKCKEKSRPEYIEGIVFAKNDCKIITAKMTEEPLSPVFTLKSYSSPWFHQRIAENPTPFLMPLYDYLFRYDRGAFWMGTYALWPKLLSRFWLEDIIENRSWMPRRLIEFLKSNPQSLYTTTRYPGPLFRLVAGPLMDSATLYRWLHWKRESWFERHFVVQDFYLPEEKTADFIRYSLDTNGIRPLWICPCKGTRTPQLFSPQAQSSELVFDVGIYGWPKEPLGGPEATQLLENQTYAFGGKKMFYSWNYLTEEQLWSHYPKKEYDALRSSYGAQGVFPDFAEKVGITLP